MGLHKFHFGGRMRDMPDATIKHVRQRLYRFRGRYREVCRRARLTYSWVSKFATGERGQRPSFDLMNRLLTALDAMEREGGRRKRRTRKDVNRDGARAARRR